ncbi:MAG: hypothetical protein GY711_22115 [bacterium]|nr:hypothetical protein [bacterium]
MKRANPVVPLLIVLAAGCQSTNGRVSGSPDDIRYMLSHGDYRAAVHAAKELTLQDPADDEAHRLHQAASVGFKVDEGRALTFLDRDVEALVEFEDALRIDPTSEIAERWVHKTRVKIGDRWYARAREMHTADNLEGAIDGYEKALEYNPALGLAREGAARVVVQLNYRDGLSDEYYNQGVRSLNEYRLWVARSRFGYASKYREGDQRPLRRVAEVDRQLSLTLAAVANTLEADGKYTAARNQFRAAKIADPNNQAAIDGFDRNVIESEALLLLKAGQMNVLRGEWENAQKELEEGKALTTAQTEAFDEQLAMIDDARAKSTYESALDCEHDFRFEEAIVTYDKLLAERDFYEDARARRNTLADYVARAAELYDRAKKARDRDERAELLRQIEVFWPEYMDVHDQLEALGAS